MSGYLFYDCRPRPLSQTGQPMPGATYTFLESQTTTPATVYADASLTTPLPNPLTADADGRFPAIYLDPAVVYRVQLHDGDGVLQYDVDPVHPHVAVPPGTIVMFEGTEQERDAAYPPALWQVCDGSNGTKDTRDRFPVGVSNTKPISGSGSTGGSTGGGLTGSAGSHTHGGATGSTVLTADNMPQHSHRLYCWIGNGSDGEHDSVSRPGGAGISGQRKDQPSGGTFGYATFGNTSNNTDQLVEPAGTASPQGHNHTISADGAHQHTLPSFTPPYFTVWFLKRRTS